MIQKINYNLEENTIHDDEYKVRGEMMQYNSEEMKKLNLNLKLLIKVQSCVRRFLNNSKFYKEHRNNRNVININISFFPIK